MCKAKLQPHKEGILRETLYGKNKESARQMVRQRVEDTLNRMLDAEADQITSAHRYVRTESGADTRAGHFRKFMIKAGEVQLKVPKLRKLPFETATIERYA